MKSETQIQAEAFQAAWNLYPETRRCIFHVPNGGSRNKIEGMQLKASGVIAGIPDVLFIWQGTIHAFEFKTEKGTISPDQSKVHKAWLSQGVKVHIVRSKDEFLSHIERITQRSFVQDKLPFGNVR